LLQLLACIDVIEQRRTQEFDIFGREASAIYSLAKSLPSHVKSKRSQK
jgi:hypothetical protein